MSSSYKKIDNNTSSNNSDDLEKSSFVKQPISKPAKKTNYGSLRTETQQNQTAKVFMVNYKHRISSGETLQGISLKYGVPIDMIKRANRLWSNDLAFVKDLLIVPIDREKLKSLHIDYEETGAAAISPINLNDVQLSTSESAFSLNNKTDLKENDEYKNYLNKFDSFISESKIKLKHLETNSNLSDYLSHNRNKTIFNTNTYSHSENDNDDDIFDIDKNNAKKSNIQTKHSSSNRTLNTSSMSSGYDSSKFSHSDTNQTLNGNGNSSSNSSSASNLNALSNENVSCESPELLIKTGKRGSKHFYGSNHNLKSSHISNSSSRARLAQENLQRLEREKDDLYEL